MTHHSLAVWRIFFLTSAVCESSSGIERSTPVIQLGKNSAAEKIKETI
jgi:hypothetical protein